MPLVSVEIEKRVVEIPKPKLEGLPTRMSTSIVQEKQRVGILSIPTHGQQVQVTIAVQIS